MRFDLLAIQETAASILFQIQLMKCVYIFAFGFIFIVDFQLTLNQFLYHST